MGDDTETLPTKFDIGLGTAFHLHNLWVECIDCYQDARWNRCLITLKSITHLISQDLTEKEFETYKICVNTVMQSVSALNKYRPSVVRKAYYDVLINEVREKMDELIMLVRKLMDKHGWLPKGEDPSFALGK